MRVRNFFRFACVGLPRIAFFWVSLVLCTEPLIAREAVENGNENHCTENSELFDRASENPTIIIDCSSHRIKISPASDDPIQVPRNHYSNIDADYVAKLILSTESIAKTRKFEIIFEHLHIDGPLFLHGVSTVARITFKNIVFKQPKETFWGSKSHSLDIARSRFEERITFEQVEFQNEVQIISSGFVHSLEFTKSIFGSRLIINDTHFRSDLDLGQNNIFRNQIQIANTEFDGDLDLSNLKFRANTKSLKIRSGSSGELAQFLFGQMTGASIGLTSNRSFDENVRLTQRVKEFAQQHLTNANALTEEWCRCRQKLYSSNFASHDFVNRKLNQTYLVNGKFLPSPIEAEEIKKDQIDPDYEEKIWAQRGQICSYATNIPVCPISSITNIVLLELNNILVGNNLIIKNVRLGKFSKDRLDAFDMSPIFFMSSVDVTGSVRIEKNDLIALQIEDSFIQSFGMRENKLERLILSNNEFGSIRSIKDNISKILVIEENTVLGSVRFLGFGFGVKNFAIKHFNVTRNASLWIRNNIIKQSLEIEPVTLTNELKEFNLNGNSIGSELHLIVPLAAPEDTLVTADFFASDQKTIAPEHPYITWPHRFSLQGVRVDGLLKFTVGILDRKRNRLIQSSEDFSFYDSDSFTEIYDGIVNKFGIKFDGFSDYPLYSKHPDVKNGSHFCGSSQYIEKHQFSQKFDLDNSFFHNIEINLPMATNCFIWSGSSIEFKNFVNPSENDNANSFLSRNIVVEEEKHFLETWRENFIQESPGTLRHMADFLASSGEIEHSLKFREDAKKLGFLSAPDLPQSLFGWPEYGWKLVVYATKMAILESTGYGTKPEKALGLIGVVAFLVWLTSLVYERFWRGPWANLSPASRPSNGMSDDRMAKKVEFIKLRLGNSLAVSDIPGFLKPKVDDSPGHLSIPVLALDTALPVIDLHVFRKFKPVSKFMNFFLIGAHLICWLLLTAFVATLTVL